MPKKLILLIVVVKISIFAIIIITYYRMPFNKPTYEINPHFPENEAVGLQTAFKTWDAQHYIHLSQVWYKPRQASDVFFPLFPFLIRIATLLFKNPLYAGLFISNFFSFIGIIYFYLFVKDYFKNKPSLATKSVYLLLIFPTSFYFSLVYSESLCFLLTILFFYFLYKNKFTHAAIIAFFLPLSRPVGIFILFPYTFYVIMYLYKRSPKKSWSQQIKKIIVDKRTYLLITPVLGLLVYFAIMYIFAGSFTSDFEAQVMYGAGWKLTNILHPEIFFKNLLAPIYAYHTYRNSVIDRFFFVLFLPLLFFIYKKLDKTLFIYAVTIGLIPLFGSFTSYIRYELLAFPIFMVGAILLETNGAKNYAINKFLVLVYLLLVLQIFFIMMHALNYWVA